MTAANTLTKAPKIPPVRHPSDDRLSSGKSPRTSAVKSPPTTKAHEAANQSTDCGEAQEHTDLRIWNTDEQANVRPVKVRPWPATRRDGSGSPGIRTPQQGGLPR